MASGGIGAATAARLAKESYRIVIGIVRVTRALLPKLVASGEGHVVVIGSTASFETYEGAVDTPRSSTRCER